MLRQANNKANQQIRKINQEIDRTNRANKRAVDEYNRSIRRYNQNARQAVSKYNQAIRSHNARVRSDRASLQRQISALKNRAASSRYITVQTSTSDLYEQFERIAQAPVQSDTYSQMVALSETESANSASVAMALLDDAPADISFTSNEDTGILDYLSGFSIDLCNRWRGAIFSLNPENPDAGRHFCTSAREIFTEILETWAEDDDVVEADPNCQRTPQGKPSRRSKIKYLLSRKGVATTDLISFVETDINNIIQLFDVFNEATHGPAGKHGFTKLKAIRQRVEGGIMFLANVAAHD